MLWDIQPFISWDILFVTCQGWISKAMVYIYHQTSFLSHSHMGHKKNWDVVLIWMEAVSGPLCNAGAGKATNMVKATILYPCLWLRQRWHCRYYGSVLLPFNSGPHANSFYAPYVYIGQCYGVVDGAAPLHRMGISLAQSGLRPPRIFWLYLTLRSKGIREWSWHCSNLGLVLNWPTLFQSNSAK